MAIPKSLSLFFLKIIHFFRLQYLLRAVYFFMFRLKNRSKCFQYKFGNYEFSLYARRASEFPFFLARRFGFVGEKNVIRQMLLHLREGDCAYDIGASIGSHSIIMAKRVGPQGLVVSFEPEPNSFQVLEKNVALNHLLNVKTFPVALGNISEKRELFSPDSGLGSFNLLSRGKSLGRSISIVQGDTWVRQNRLRLPHAVKIDVEGYEHFVLQGLSQTLSSAQCLMLCCEIHPHMLPSGISAEDVMGLIQSFGFNRIDTQLLAKTYHVFCYKEC